MANKVGESIQPSSRHESTIPMLFHCTYHSKNSIPAKVDHNHTVFLPGFEVKLYDDVDGEAFISEHFQDKVLLRFRELSGAHRADLLRYCILYVLGGVYADIKTEFILDMPTLVQVWESSNSQIVDEGLNPKGLVVLVNSLYQPNTIYNGFMAASPRQFVFLAAISRIVDSPKNATKRLYNVFVKQLFEEVKADCDGVDPRPGLVAGENSTYYFLEERRFPIEACHDGKDRYGLCMFITDPELSNVVKVRYADYPWPKIGK